MPVDTIVVPERPAVVAYGGGRNGSFGDGLAGGNGDRFHGRHDLRLKTYRLGMWLAMLGMSMVFVALTSALIVRRGLTNDWYPTALPPLVWLNAAILAASSFTIERARRALDTLAFARWWLLTTALGAAFLGGQTLVWRELASRGVFIASNPSSSFLYLLTGLHALHLAGGIFALLYVLIRARRAAVTVAVEVTALYWHFLDGLWLYLLAVLLIWR
jgi:cytochrome c oxidase subunit 3